MTEKLDQIPWDDIREHLFSGNKIQAIKAYREAAGVGLKEAKTFIDELEDRMRDEFPDHFKGRGSKGCLGLLLLAFGGTLTSSLLLAALAAS